MTDNNDKKPKKKSKIKKEKPIPKNIQPDSIPKLESHMNSIINFHSFSNIPEKIATALHSALLDFITSNLKTQDKHSSNQGLILDFLVLKNKAQDFIPETTIQDIHVLQYIDFLSIIIDFTINEFAKNNKMPPSNGHVYPAACFSYPALKLIQMLKNVSEASLERGHLVYPSSHAVSDILNAMKSYNDDMGPENSTNS